MDLVIATAAQGVLWGLYALGVYLTYRVLDIADLTVEGIADRGNSCRLCGRVCLRRYHRFFLHET